MIGRNLAGGRPKGASPRGQLVEFLAKTEQACRAIDQECGRLMAAIQAHPDPIGRLPAIRAGVGWLKDWKPDGVRQLATWATEALDQAHRHGKIEEMRRRTGCRISEERKALSERLEYVRGVLEDFVAMHPKAMEWIEKELPKLGLGVDRGPGSGNIRMWTVE